MGWSGVWVPSKRLRLGCGCESTGSEALDQWSVKGPWPSVLQKRISTQMESSKVSKVFIRRKKVQYLWRNTQEDSQESPWVVPKWQWKLLIWGISSSFPLANHSDLPGSQSVFGISQDPLLCVHASLSQDGFYWKAVWVEHPLSSLSFGLQGNFLYMCGQGGLLTLIMRNMGSGWGPASLP